MEIFTDAMKMAAINFATWLEDNAWTAIYSNKLKKRAYVDASENNILVNGSDEHFTKLINEKGKTLEELYVFFLKDECNRIKLETQIKQ